MGDSAPSTVWFTGLPASGKTTLARAVAGELAGLGLSAHVVDGDELRKGLTRDLGFLAQDRAESVRRAGEVALVLVGAGVIPLVSLVSPYRVDRDLVRSRHAEREVGFFEVFVDTPLETCQERDPKGLYARARSGEISAMTGIDDPYQPPEAAELVVTPDSGMHTVGQVLQLLDVTGPYTT